MEMKHLVYLSVILFLSVGLEAVPVKTAVNSSVNQKIEGPSQINADPPMTEENINEDKESIDVFPSDSDESEDDDFESAEVLTQLNTNNMFRVLDLAHKQMSDKNPGHLSVQLNFNYKPTHNVSPVYVNGDTFVAPGMVPPFPVDESISENIFYQEEDQ